MTTAARIKEADAAAKAFQIALAQQGAATVKEALSLWQDVPTNVTPAQASRWLTKAVTMILSRRVISRELAVAYYRLTRALRTGYTIPMPGEKSPSTVTLADLRQDFRMLSKNPLAGPTTDGSAKIIVDKIAGLMAEDLASERAAELQARVMLGALGPASLRKRIAKLDETKPATQIDGERLDAHSAAGARQAAAAASVVMNGARGAIFKTVIKDPRAIGYIRLSKTGTPCAWCAMLISRGAVYQSKKSAGLAIYGDGEKYHTNCYCYAEAVFSKAQYNSSDLYALNRQYERDWPEVAKKLKKGQSMSDAWKEYIRTNGKSLEL